MNDKTQRYEDALRSIATSYPITDEGETLVFIACAALAKDRPNNLYASPVFAKHIPPTYYGYLNRRQGRGGGWTDVTVCKGCGTRALYEDRHPVTPCPDCGGKLSEQIGRWIREPVPATGWLRRIFPEYVYSWQLKGEQ